MKIHHSVEQFYHVLYKLNPILEYFVHAHCDGYWSGLLTELGMKKYDYNFMNSLLFKVTTDPMLRYDNGIPIAIVSYNIIFAVGTNFTGLPLASKNDRINNYTGCKFYKDFFEVQPENVIMIDQLGYHFTDTCVYGGDQWCEKCNGSFAYAGNLRRLMRDEMDFQTIPREAIICIEEIFVPIDKTDPEMMAEVTELMEIDAKTILCLQSRITTLEDRIKKMVEDELVKHASDKAQLQYMLSQCGRISYSSDQNSSINFK